MKTRKTKTRQPTAIAALTCAALLSAPSWAISPEEVFSRASKSVVMVLAGPAPAHLTTQGSGVVVSSNLAITNCHVAQSAGKPHKAIVVVQGGRRYDARVVAANTEYDSCLMHVVGLDGMPAEIADSGSLRVGQRVYAIGAPSGLELTLTDGLLSALRTVGRSHVIQTSASISPGSSGGGLFNDQGQLIGITSFGIGTGTGLNFAYRADAILGLIKLASNSTDHSIFAISLASLDYVRGRVLPESESEIAWLSAVERRLKRRIPEAQARRDFLKVIAYEAARAGVDRVLVLALIDVVSDFDAQKVDTRRGIGLMQVHPSWKEIFGRPEHDLFDVRTNVRYGTTLLRSFVDTDGGDLFRALNRYYAAMNAGPRGAGGKLADSNFPNQVRSAMQRWSNQ